MSFSSLSPCLTGGTYKKAAPAVGGTCCGRCPMQSVLQQRSRMCASRCTKTTVRPAKLLFWLDLVRGVANLAAHDSEDVAVHSWFPL
jgi:hypothetical protein